MAKTSSKNQQGLYSAYKTQNKQASNRKRKLLKLQKQQPNNEQIAKALLNIKYRRCTPKTSHWSHSAIYYAKLIKSFTKGASKPVPKMIEKAMFSLKERAHCNGVLVWNS